MKKPTGRRKSAVAPQTHDPQRLLKKLFAQFQKQVDELERRSGNKNPERDAKLLAALAATLERLNALDEIMKKKQDKKNAAGGLDRGTILRELCARLEKLAKQEDGA